MANLAEEIFVPKHYDSLYKKIYFIKIYKHYDVTNMIFVCHFRRL